jgi:signal recognition particle GTPase
VAGAVSLSDARTVAVVAADDRRAALFAQLQRLAEQHVSAIGFFALTVPGIAAWQKDLARVMREETQALVIAQLAVLEQYFRGEGGG